MEQIVAERLKLAQQSKGWPGYVAADHLHTNKCSYSQYTRGHRYPPVSLLVKAAEVYDKKVGWFFGEQ